MLLPIYEIYFPQSSSGIIYQVEIRIEPKDDDENYPEGVKASFKMFKLNEMHAIELMVLLDNHKPFGFHYHDKLPDQHESRVKINTHSWQQAWHRFQFICREILHDL